MFSIRYITRKIIFNIKDRKIISEYNRLLKSQFNSSKSVSDKQITMLNELLNHAYNKVPYYKKILSNTGLLKDGKIVINTIDQLTKIPVLTKEIIGTEKENLHSSDIDSREAFKNTTGGSTGEPVAFMQDFKYSVSNMGNAYLARSWRGAGIYDSTVILWGAERDTFEGKKSFFQKVKDYLLNTQILNTFVLSNAVIESYIKILNKKKPKLVIAYVNSIYSIAQYAKAKMISVKPQYAIHAAAGTVYPFMRDEIETVFGCKVFNHYGSREAGAIASECSAHDGMHLFMEHNLIEVIDLEGKICKPGESGEILITSLTNYSMPLIRYKIGDIGVLSEYKQCQCGCNYPKLEKVVGRSTDVFKTENGSVVMPEYFIHLIGVACNKGNIKFFQVIQESLKEIKIKIVKNGDIDSSSLNEIEEKIKIVMGDLCNVEFEFVDVIPKTKTGKYLYTVTKI